MSEYRVITVCSHVPIQNYFCLQQFFKSLNGEGVLGLGTQPNEYGGLGSKPRLLYNAIKGGAVLEKYIIFTDCFDFVFTKSPEEMFKAYKTYYHKPVVISAEKNCFPTTYKEQYDQLNHTTSPYKYLNSGMIVGETDAIMACLESMDAKNIPNDYFDVEKNVQVNPNDQEYWQAEFLKQPVEIVMDKEQWLCNTLHSVSLGDLEFNEYGILNKETNVYPRAFHLNGSAKTDGLRNPILSHLKLL